MGRLEKFREARQSKRKYVFAFFLFFFLILPGLYIADYSTNTLMKNQNHAGIVSFKKLSDTYFELDILDKKIHINTIFVSRDFQNLKKKIDGSSTIK